MTALALAHSWFHFCSTSSLFDDLEAYLDTDKTNHVHTIYFYVNSIYFMIDLIFILNPSPCPTVF